MTVVLPPISYLTAQPIHWIYDDSVLTKVLAGASNPEFITPSANPYYRLSTGCQSPYGDQLLVMLESLVACKGGKVLFKQIQIFALAALFRLFLTYL